MAFYSTVDINVFLFFNSYIFVTNRTSSITLDSREYVKWFIFLTDWAYLALTVATLVDAVVVIYVYVKRHDIRRGK